jgi:hypothetical protein
MKNQNSFTVKDTTDNGKLGKGCAVISTDDTSCPDICPLKAPQPGYKKGPCFGSYGPVNWHWSKLSNGTAKNIKLANQVYSWLRTLPLRQIVRYNVVGDLPSTDGATIEPIHFAEMAKGAKKRKLKLFGYSHHDMAIAKNRKTIMSGYDSGLVMSASVDTFQDGINLKRLEPGLSVVSTARHDYTIKQQTIQGQSFVLCPATYNEAIQCDRCEICTKPRDFIIVFPAHGSGKNAVGKMIDSLELIATDRGIAA